MFKTMPRQSLFYTSISEEVLLKEKDYQKFKLNSILYFQKNRSELKSSWEVFCKKFNEPKIPFKMSEKFMLLKAAYLCSKQPIDQGELAQFLMNAVYLKNILGIKILQLLFNSQIVDQKLSNYITVMQLLLELQEQSDLITLVQKSLPNILILIEKLRERHEQLLLKKYPERNIEEAIEQFSLHKNRLDFPLSKSELEFIQSEYIQVHTFLKLIRQDSLDILNKIAWDTKSKNQRIAVIAEMIRRFFKISPYDTQIIALLAILNFPKHLKGRIAQIQTGEGKSTVLAMLAAYFGCQGHTVDLITTTTYLAKRDALEYEPFFAALSLTCSHISEEPPSKKQATTHILYGKNTDFEFWFLRCGLNGEDYPRRGIILVDEADNLFLKLNAAIMSVPNPESSLWVYEPILSFVKKNLTPTVKDCRTILTNYQAGLYSSQVNIMTDSQLDQWINSAKRALYFHEEGKDYSFDQEEQKIVIINYDDTGAKEEGCQWQRGVHQFLETKHGLKASSESFTAASISHPSFFNLYNHVFGLTGTMGETSERKEIEDIYRVDSFDVPPHFPCQRIYLPALIADDKKSQDLLLLKKVREDLDANRPILLLFKSINESYAFSDQLKKAGITHQVLNTKQKEEAEYIIARAGEAGMVTVATNFAGRGAHIKLSKESKVAGGLAQFFTFYPRNSRVQGQGFGRSGRQGEPGSCQMILRQDDDLIQYLLNRYRVNLVKVTPNDLVIIDKLRSRMVEEESVYRLHSAKIENLCYEKLSVYFNHSKAVYQLFNNVDFLEKLKQICCQPLEKVTIKASNSIKNYEEKALIDQAMVLSQRNKDNVDWSSFINQFKEYYLQMMQQCWAGYYSNLYKEIDHSGDLKTAQENCNSLYEKIREDLEKFTLQYELAAVECLQMILSTRISTQTATNFYERGIAEFKLRNFESAKILVEQALALFISSKESAQSLQIGKCYSTIASCYREIGKIDEAIIACENAIPIYILSAEENEISRLLTKYRTCLEANTCNALEIYKSGVEQFKAKQYSVCKYKLQFALDKFLKDKESKINIATCHSTLASCLRELKELDSAIYHAEQAVDLKKQSGTNSKDIEKEIIKLEGLKKITENNNLNFRTL